MEEEYDAAVSDGGGDAYDQAEDGSGSDGSSDQRGGGAFGEGDEDDDDEQEEEEVILDPVNRPAISRLTSVLQPTDVAAVNRHMITDLRGPGDGDRRPHFTSKFMTPYEYASVVTSLAEAISFNGAEFLNANFRDVFIRCKQKRITTAPDIARVITLFADAHEHQLPIQIYRFVRRNKVRSSAIIENKRAVEIFQYHELIPPWMVQFTYGIGGGDDGQVPFQVRNRDRRNPERHRDFSIEDEVRRYRDEVIENMARMYKAASVVVEE